MVHIFMKSILVPGGDQQCAGKCVAVPAASRLPVSVQTRLAPSAGQLGQ